MPMNVYLNESSGHPTRRGESRPRCLSHWLPCPLPGAGWAEPSLAQIIEVFKFYHDRPGGQSENTFRPGPAGPGPPPAQLPPLQDRARRAEPPGPDSERPPGQLGLEKIAGARPSLTGRGHGR
jgi:hypothetical protein